MKKSIKVILLSMLVTYGLLNASLYDHSSLSQPRTEAAEFQGDPVHHQSSFHDFEEPAMPEKPWELTIDYKLTHPGEQATAQELLDYHREMARLLQLEKNYKRKLQERENELFRREVAYQQQFQGVPRGVDMPVEDPFGERDIAYSSFADLGDSINQLLQEDREEEALLMLQRGHKPKNSSLYVASKLGYENMITPLLVNNYGELRKHMDVNHMEEGQTALHAAVLGNHHAVIQGLQSFNVDPNIPNREGLTPLELGASMTSVNAETLRTLRDAFSASIDSNQYKRAYGYALQQEAPEKLEVLGPHIGMDHLEQVAMSGGAGSIVHLLNNQAQGVSVTLKKINELLRLATEYGNKDVVHALLDHYSANPYDKVGPDNRSAWDVASSDMSGIFCKKYFNDKVCAVSGSFSLGRNYVNHIVHDMPQTARRVASDVGEYLHHKASSVGLTPRPQQAQHNYDLPAPIGFRDGLSQPPLKGR